MSVLDRVRRRAVPRGNARASVLPDIKLHVAEENDSFIADDGSRIWTSGYALLDDTTGSFMRMRDQHFDNRHCLLCRVAGVTYRPEALQDPRFAPGHAVRLIPEPTNPYDQNAVGIWDASGDIQLGFVPGDQSARVASDMRAGTQLVGFILREFRRGKEGPRLGIHVLVVPSGTLELVVESPDDD
jgi:hypothetical protein